MTSQPTESHSPEPAGPTQTFGSSSSNAGAAPRIDPNANVPEQRVEQKPPTNGTNEVQPSPGDELNETNEAGVEDPYKVDPSDNSTFNEAPQLFDPNDRTVLRGPATVKTAVFKQAASYRSISARPITAEQAQKDAAGWSGAN